MAKNVTVDREDKPNLLSLQKTAIPKFLLE